MSKRKAPRSSERASNQKSGAPQYRYPIPQASVQAFHAWIQQSPQNPGLIFDRFMPDLSDQSILKKDGLETVCKAAQQADGALLQGWNRRWEACAQAANAEPFTLKTDWRLVAGLGRKGPLEVGFTFHRYGFPILPGSSVKGIARARALIQLAQQANAASLQTLADVLSAVDDPNDPRRQPYKTWRNAQPPAVQTMADDFRIIFGTIAAAGCAIFFDAIPASVPQLELDVMNPHFPQYYQGNEPPSDWQSPVPVYFLTVAPGTEFRFAVGWRCALDSKGRRLRELVQAWLIAGLTELGAGAKTSAGYGYFTPPATSAMSPLNTGEATTLAPAPAQPEELIWRIGTVREYHPERNAGRLADDETNQEFRFSSDAIEEKGWSPGKKHKVWFALVERDGRRVVVKVRKKG